MIIEPPDKGWVVHVDEDIDNACEEDGIWSAPEISTDHYVLDSDTAAFAYGKHFLGRVSEKGNPYKGLPYLVIEVWWPWLECTVQ